MLNRIGNTGVLGHALVIEIDLAVLVDGHVLEQRVALDGVIDIGLGFFIQTDDLCIAAALKVEDAVVVPTVLVVADQQALGVSGEGGLTGAGQTEEDSGVLAFHIGVGGAVHGSDALQGQVVVHHGEHTLLHLAAVPGVQDDLLTGGDVEDRRGLGVEPQLLVVLDLRLGSVVADEIRLKVLELLLGGLDEHVLDEVSLPSDLHDEADRHTGVLVRAAEAVYDIELLAGELLERELLARVPCLFGRRMVIVGILGSCPPNGVLRSVIHDDELIFGGSSGVDTGHDVDGVQLGELTLIKAGQRGIHLVLEKLFVRGIINNLLYAVDTILG